MNRQGGWRGSISTGKGRRAKKPKLLETWGHVVGELGGDVELTDRGKPRRAYIPHRDWLVVVDIYTVNTGSSTSRYARVRALFQRIGPFSLRVTRRNPFHALARLVGWGGIEIGYGKLDRTLFVRSDRPDIARPALRGSSLGQALLRNPAMKLVVTRPGKRIRTVTGDGVGEVQLLKSGVVRDVALLRELIQIVTGTLDELERLNVAQADPVAGIAV